MTIKHSARSYPFEWVFKGKGEKGIRNEQLDVIVTL
jgi:hypothetical protein